MDKRKIVYSCIYILIGLALPELTKNGLRFVGGALSGILEASGESVGSKMKEEVLKAIKEWF